MPDVLRVPVSRGYIDTVVENPELKGVKRAGSVLSFKGIGWDALEEAAGRPSIFSGNISQIDKFLVDSGNCVISVSHTGYDTESLGNLSLTGYLADLAVVVRTLEAQFGERVAIMGHSLGAYIALRLLTEMRSQDGQPQPYNAALIGLPLSPREAFELLANGYQSLPRIIKPLSAMMALELVNAWTKLAYRGGARPIPANQALLEELVTAPALDDLVRAEANGHHPLQDSRLLIAYGTSDPRLSGDNGLGFAKQQSIEEYAARCRTVIPPGSGRIVVLEGQGHNFETASRGQIMEFAGLLNTFFRCSKLESEQMGK